MSFSLAFDTSALLPDFKEHAQRGIGRYVQELKNYFDRVSDPQIGISYFDHRDVIGAGTLSSLLDRLPAGRQTIKQQIFYPFRLRQGLPGQSDLIHFPAHMDAPSWSGRKIIVTVLDLIPLVLEDFYRPAMPGWRFKLARWLENRAIQAATHVLAISENTARDVQRLLGVPPQKITVTPLGVDEKFFAVQANLHEKHALKARYGIAAEAKLILYVGGIDQRKNMPGLLQVFRGVLEESRAKGATAPVLFMAGRIEQDRQYPAFLSRLKDYGLEEQLRILGYVSDPELFELYAACDVFFFPSLYEGFGLPPLEAMAAGLPVVSSNTSAMPEVIGDAAALVDPGDVAGAVSEIQELLSNTEYASALREKGRKRARLFTWDKTGELTLAAYRKIAGPL